MDRINVVVDMDDTITNSSQYVLKLLNERYESAYLDTDIYRYDFTDIFPDMKREELISLFEQEDFYDRCGAIKDAIETINKHSLYDGDNFFKFHICTIGTQQNLLNKYNWIMNHIFGDINIIGVLDGNNKDKVNMKNSIQIDDKYDYLVRTNSKIKILLTNGYDREYNKVRPNDEIYVVDNWKQIDEILYFCKNNAEEFMNI